MNDLQIAVKEYLSKHPHLYTNVIYRALRVKSNYNLSLNKFRLCLRDMEKSGTIESVVENVGLPYWRLK
jgi:hypothetical protein